MNEEHFLTELKIYLNPLSKDKLTEILQLFAELFDEGQTGNMSEEAVAKALGKPKEIAQEILQFYHIKVKEKEIYQNDWQEIPPQYDYQDFNEEEEGEEDDFESSDRPFLPRFLMLLFHLFVGIWIIFAIYMALFGAWMTVVAFSAAPLISIFSFAYLPTSAALLVFFTSLILLGISFFMIAIGRPLTSVLHQISKKYLQFAHRVIREGR